MITPPMLRIGEPDPIRRRLGPRLASASGLLVLLVAPWEVASSASAAPTPSPPTVSAQPASPAPQQESCAEASTLTTHGYPQRAASLIDKINAGLAVGAPRECPEARATALGAVEQAQRQALESQSLLDAGESSQAKETAQRALIIDKENALALGVVAKAVKPGFWQRTLTAWNNFIENPVTPMGGVLLAALTLAAVLLVAARLLAWGRSSWPTGTSAEWAQQRLRAGLAWGAGGVLLVFAGSSLSTVETALVFLPGTAFVAGVVLCLVGTWLVAQGLATRLRVGVVARVAGAEDSAGAAQVLALLDDLGASPPKGLERPRGADVEALKEALGDLGDHPIVKVIQGIIATIAGAEPWKVVVDEEKSGSLSVSMVRNGRTVKAAVIDRAALGLDPPTKDAAEGEDEAFPDVDLHRFVAAFALTTLSEKHEGFEGLCGTTDWVSLGLHYVATTDFPKDKDTATRLLAEAVRRDPNNWLAQVALTHLRWRHTESADIRKMHQDWLDKAIALMSSSDDSDGPAEEGYQVLRLRAEFTRNAVLINRHFAEPAEVTREEVRTSIAKLCMTLNDQPSEFDKGWLAESQSRAAGRALLLLDNPAADHIESAEWVNKLQNALPPDPVARGGQRAPSDRQMDPAIVQLAASLEQWLKLPRGPQAHYSFGCSYASRLSDPAADRQRAAREKKAADRKAAVELLQAVDHPDLAEWLPKDPQLDRFRATDEYRKYFAPKPRTDMLDLDPFKSCRAALEVLGLQRPSAWENIPTNRLALSIPLPFDQAERLQDHAIVACRILRELMFKPYAIELLALLLKDEVARPADLRILATQPDLEERAQAWAAAVHKFVAGKAPTQRALRRRIVSWVKGF